ncbi:MAG: trehalose-phosphatase [Gammaproteobacteria bacterium]
MTASSTDTAREPDEQPRAEQFAIQAGRYAFILFDLDGVLTRTAKLHAQAWKQTFDCFLGAEEGHHFRPFDIKADYLTYVDGKPRLTGVDDFVRSRGYRLPIGHPTDRPGEHTLWALGNAKNNTFGELLAAHGVDTYGPGVDLVYAARKSGMQTGVVSSSRNCMEILRAAGLASCFDVILDGNESARLDLRGKPAPDTYVEAAKRLGFTPERGVVIEDAQAGVESARKGGFGLVIGVDRGGQGAALAARGAHLVVSSLSGVAVTPRGHALKQIDDVLHGLDASRLVVLLDYDGTLTPIVNRPQDACLGEAMRATVQGLAERCPVVLVSGRDLPALRELAPLQDVIYVADHGLVIAGRGLDGVGVDDQDKTRQGVAELAAQLEAEFSGVDGVLIERKVFSVAVHYRLVAPSEAASVRRRVRDIAAKRADMKLLDGKKVKEFVPRLGGDKGSAVQRVLGGLGRAVQEAIYIGDDVTDEAAFRALGANARTIVVGELDRPSAARWQLRDVGEVQDFLTALGQWIRTRAKAERTGEP